VRKITIYSTKTKAQQVIETGLSTWGEVKQLINPEMGISSGKCMVRENRTTLESNQALLPDGDATIFVYPEKVKSGSEKRDDDVYSSLSDWKLKEACQRKSLVTNEKGHVMRSKLRSYDARHGFSGPKAHLKVKGTSRPTVMKKEELLSYTKGLEPATDLDKEAAELQHPDSSSIVLSSNNEISIHAIVKLMRNKFENMFDELEEEIADGTIAKDADVLEKQAQAIAKEAGISISENHYEDGGY
jgi:hypothetical protein